MAKKININTSKKVTPMIYAYTTPEIKRHDGWTKIGYTEQDVIERIKQQTHTADIAWNLEWKGNAIYDDGSGDKFTDKDFHTYLRKRNIEQEKDKNNEWFHITGPESKNEFNDFRANRGILEDINGVIPYILRKEQNDAVNKTVDYLNTGKNKEFLWNAKPRFGKTLSVYDFCKKIDAKKILIVTNRPAIANSWYSDYEKFIGTEDGYYFVSEVDSLKGKPFVLSRKAYLELQLRNENTKCIEFVSLQDLKGSIYFGGQYDKLEEVKNLHWDVLVIDEAHEGVDTYKTDLAFDNINRTFTLHLSGTPFKALANDKFEEQAIYNWTYADEQQAKRDWSDEEVENPYANLPCLNLFTYQMSEIVRDEVEQGMDFEGDKVNFAFDLNEFFETNSKGFIHESAVDKFLDALTKQEKFPFSTEDLRNELKHTFWILNRVDSAKALAKKLKEHPVFKDYEIILAAGDGKLSEDEENKKSYNKVVDAIAKFDKTITLSVGQLTTGITIPEWTAVLMLSNMKSPALYMQAAFRAQNPCLFSDGVNYYRKQNAYVFDFDPARTLTIFEEFANDLSVSTSSGRGDIEQRKENVKRLINFFPVIGEDENGEMIPLDAEKVLSIPRKIRSQEVVKRGFMSDFLFQNVTNIFHAPQEVIDMIKKFTPTSEPKHKLEIDTKKGEDLNIGPDGEVKVPEELVIGKEKEVFGEKIYETISKKLEDTITTMTPPEDSKNDLINQMKKQFETNVTSALIETAQKTYGDELKGTTKKKLEENLKATSTKVIEKEFGNYKINKNVLEQEHEKELDKCKTEKEKDDLNKKFEEESQKLLETFKSNLNEKLGEVTQEAGKTIVETIETKKREDEKKSITDTVKDHLRGFSRTIPSFLMAYGNGNNTITLATFDTIIPDKVFIEVTSITLEQFKFLRDGGEYEDENGEMKFFEGKLFDEVVFDDSVKEFLSLKKKLANYFDEKAIEDIFDYIPPQKTNQIFTPKNVVKEMVDMLEQENPGCFDMPDKTFFDMYMKSGLYITEIVKRLYQSEKMKELYPDDKERLRHIFKEQVYGLAPTEIIYNIAINYILGFDETIDIKEHNLVLCDAQKFIENGTLEEELDRLFGK